MGCILKGGGGLYSRLVVGAVLLATGSGSRLGSRPKSLLELGGVPLIRRQLIALSGAGVDEVVVVLGHHAGAIETSVQDFPVTLARNLAPDDGQASSVRIGLRALTGKLDAVIVAELATARPAGAEVPAQSARPAAGSDARSVGDAPVLDLAAARARRRWPRWAAPGAVVGIAAAAVVVVLAVGVGTRAPRPSEGSAPAAPVLTAGQLAGQWPGVRGVRDLGFLAPPGKLAGCLGAYAPPGDGPVNVLGARPVVVDGRYGVLVVVPGPYDYPVGDQVQLVVVGPQCDQKTDHDVIATATAPL